MKSVFLGLISCCIFSLQLPAQKGQPAFGKVDKADLLMTDCDFDKGAAAVVLIDYGYTYYDRGTVGFSLFKTIFERRIRIKILKEKGIAEANVEIPFYSNHNAESIVKLKARTYNLDERGKIKVTEVKKNSIYTKKTDANYSKVIITFPEVKAGSIIEYIYAVERETQESIRNWYFQGSIPVRFSEYELIIPQIFRFIVKRSVIDTLEEKNEVIDELINGAERVVQTKSIRCNYIMRRLPGIKSEPFMGSPKDYMQRLEFQLNQVYYNESKITDISLKWEDVIKELMAHADFGMQLQSRIRTTYGLIEEAGRIADAETRMKFIYEFIRKTSRWNEDDHIYTDKGITTAWATKTGNTADLNLLLVKLLRDAGLKASPVLFSTRDHGIPMPHYPFLNQFNTLMAFVVANGKTFVLDATGKLNHYKLVPEKVVNTSGFIVEGEKGSWMEIEAGKNKYKMRTAIQGEIDESGNMKGTALVTCYDYARVKKVKSWLNDKEHFRNEYLIKPYPTIHIEDIASSNLNADSLPFEQKIKFTSTLNSSGGYRYFAVNLFSDLVINPFVADSRISDIDFGVQQEYSIFGSYTLPAGFAFEGLPANVSMTTADNSIIFTRTVQVESNLLNVRMTLDFKKTFYTADSYPEFREFYKKLMDKLNEQVVIKKKTAP